MKEIENIQTALGEWTPSDEKAAKLEGWLVIKDPSRDNVHIARCVESGRFETDMDAEDFVGHMPSNLHLKALIACGFIEPLAAKINSTDPDVDKEFVSTLAALTTDNLLDPETLSASMLDKLNYAMWYYTSSDTASDRELDADAVLLRKASSVQYNIACASNIVIQNADTSDPSVASAIKSHQVQALSDLLVAGEVQGFNLLEALFDKLQKDAKDFVDQQPL